MPNKKEFIYPFFLECCQFTKDTFWIKIFENLACGMAPYGTYISKGYLCCSFENKKFTYRIERKDAKVLYDDIYDLLTNKVGILSKKQKQKKRVDFNQLEKDLQFSHKKWSEIRKPTIKDLLYEQYIIDMWKKHSLTIKQARYLLAVISLAKTFKIINNNDIVYENNKITHIKSIEIKNKRIFLKRKLYSSTTASSIKEPSPPTKEKLADGWTKYIHELKKKKFINAKSNI